MDRSKSTSAHAEYAGAIQNASSWVEHFQQQLEQLSRQRLLRWRGASGNRHVAELVRVSQRQLIDDAVAELPGVSIDQSSSTPIDFGSNDYLGLKQHPVVLKAAAEGIRQFGWGSAASPVLTGYGDAHKRLERSLAALSGCEDCLVFSSGYACNVGVLSALIDEDTVVFSDRLNHASLIDGIRLSRGAKVIYEHCNMEHLQELITVHRSSRARGLIVTESVFSMDGDEAPLEQLVQLAEQTDCALVVDEAHATGVLGHSGAGLLQELGLSERVLVKLGTLSKALGGIGGYAAGGHPLIQLLVNRCRSYIFSTAPPAAAMAAAAAAVELLPSLTAERKYLNDLSQQLRQRLVAQGWQVPPGRSPILPVIVGDAETTLRISQSLLERQIYVPAIRPPTVPPGTSRLRISLSTSHSADDIECLTSELSTLSKLG